MVKKISPIVGFSAEYVTLPNGGVKVLKVVRKSTGYTFDDPKMIRLCEANIKAILGGWIEVDEIGYVVGDEYLP